METCWKRCAGLATDFAYRYRSNIFFRTTTKVIFLLLIFAGSIAGIVIFGLLTISEGVERSLVDGLHSAVGIRESAVLREINDAITAIPISELFMVFGFLVLVVILFGFVVAKIALRPTREALASQKLFIGNVAHELRTPLAIVKTNIEVALLDRSLDSELRRALTDNVEELDRSSDIINNLLSLNTLLNPSSIPFGNVDLGACAEEAISKLAPLATQRGVQLALTKKEFLIVRGNTSALVQVAINLIKNAITHTPKGGRVTVSLLPDYRGYIELRVIDTGEGIPQQDLLHVFEPFYQSDKSRTKKHGGGGSGLGLTIVSEIAKLHGGKIVIQSSAKKGTAVIVSIPCGDTSAPHVGELPDSAEQIAVDFTKHNNPNIRK